MQADVKISVAALTGQERVALNITLDDEPGTPVIEVLLERWEAIDLADELQHAANQQ